MLSLTKEQAVLLDAELNERISPLFKKCISGRKKTDILEWMDLAGQKVQLEGCLRTADPIKAANTILFLVKLAEDNGIVDRNESLEYFNRGAETIKKAWEAGRETN